MKTLLRFRSYCRSILPMLVASACAVLLGLSAEASLYANTKGVRSADVTVAVGKEATVTLLNSSTSSDYEPYFEPTSSECYEVTAPSKIPKATSSSNLGSAALTIRGVKATSSTQVVTVWKNSKKKDTSIAINITVTGGDESGDEPATGGSFAYEGCMVTATGATTNYVDGEVVLTFKASGTLQLSDDVRADILVVGGGGSGAAGKKGKNWYGGKGGDGGNGSVGTCTMPEGCYAITIGAGGAAVEGGTEEPDVKAGNDGKPSSVELTTDGSFEKITGSGGSGGDDTISKNTDSSSGTDGNCPESDIAGGAAKKYGKAGGGCTYNKNNKVAVNGTSGAAGTGDGGNGGAYSGTSGAGGDGIVIIRLKDVIQPRVPIAVPAAAGGLVFDNTLQVGVTNGAHYTLGGTCAATDAGEYAATATPADGYCWSDGTYGTKTVAWTIFRRQVTVTALATNKVVGADEPVYPTKAEGLVASDDAELTWKVWRTNLTEGVGTCDLVVSGAARQANYDITYVNGIGAFEIRASIPLVLEVSPGGTNSVKVAEEPTTPEEIAAAEAEAVEKLSVVIDDPAAAAAGQASVVKKVGCYNPETQSVDVMLVIDEEKADVESPVEELGISLDEVARTGGGLVEIPPEDVTPGLYYSIVAVRDLGDFAAAGGQVSEGPRVLATPGGTLKLVFPQMTDKEGKPLKSAFFRISANLFASP